MAAPRRRQGGKAGPAIKAPTPVQGRILFIAHGADVIDENIQQPLEKRVGFGLLTGDDEEDIDTLGGLVFSLAGRVPTRGELIVHPSGLQFEIVDADPRRIKRLRVQQVPPAKSAPVKSSTE